VGVRTLQVSYGQRRVGATRRRAGGVPLLLGVALSSAGCLGDLVHSAPSAVVYAFATPLPDTTMNVGENSRVLPCQLTANGRDVACRLEVTVAGGSRSLVYAQGHVSMDSLGAAVVAMRPVNAQLPNDTIVRTATVRGVAPEVRFGVAGTEDTLIAVGQEKLLIAMATTRAGRIITGAPIRWSQDSGAAVAMLVSNAPGWIRALGNGVAVFRASTDTASATRRVLVQLLPYPSPGPTEHAVVGGRPFGARP
jgi:hypothetical protein